MAASGHNEGTWGTVGAFRAGAKNIFMISRARSSSGMKCA